MKRGSIYVPLVFILLISFILALIIPGKGAGYDMINIILGMASFVFGVILAFSIANRHSRLGNIRSSLREQDALLLNIHLSSKAFGQDITNKIQGLIDSLLISQIDYKLVDFNKAGIKETKELFTFITSLKTKNQSQDMMKEKMHDNIEGVLKVQKHVEYEVKNQMFFYEWASLIILDIIIIFCLFFINDNSAVSAIIISLLTTSFILLLLVLEELNSLEWQEQNWIWIPLAQLFTELDLLPYFPLGVFKDKRINPEDFKRFESIRIAHYPNPYPNMQGKTVETIKT